MWTLRAAAAAACCGYIPGYILYTGIEALYINSGTQAAAAAVLNEAGELFWASVMYLPKGACDQELLKNGVSLAAGTVVENYVLLSYS